MFSYCVIQVDLPLKITEEEVFYWKDSTGSMQHTMHNMPIFIVHGDTHFYGLPQVDIPGVKSIHFSSFFVSFLFFLPHL